MIYHVFTHDITQHLKKAQEKCIFGDDVMFQMYLQVQCLTKNKKTL